MAFNVAFQLGLVDLVFRIKGYRVEDLEFRVQG